MRRFSPSISWAATKRVERLAPDLGPLIDWLRRQALLGRPLPQPADAKFTGEDARRLLRLIARQQELVAAERLRRIKLLGDTAGELKSLDRELFETFLISPLAGEPIDLEECYALHHRERTREAFDGVCAVMLARMYAVLGAFALEEPSR